jgi:hypothetical protein
MVHDNHCTRKNAAVPAGLQDVLLSDGLPAASQFFSIALVDKPPALSNTYPHG